MSPHSAEKLAFGTTVDHLDVILDRRETEGELAVPNFFAALEQIPLGQRHTMGTLLRESLIKNLCYQNGFAKAQEERKQQEFQEENNSAMHQLRQKLRQLVGLPPVELSPGTPSPMPSFGDELRWLREYVDEDCPTQCILLSEFCSFGNRMDLARYWYEKGMKATRRLAEQNPDTPIVIIE